MSEPVKHTPGPWAVLTGTVGGFSNQVCVERPNKPLIFVNGYEADARLIAAAPNLLAACEPRLGMEWIEALRELAEKERAPGCHDPRVGRVLDRLIDWHQHARMVAASAKGWTPLMAVAEEYEAGRGTGQVKGEQS